MLHESLLSEQGTSLLSPDLNDPCAEIVAGRGVFLYDRTGRRYLDGCSGAIVANIGHGVAEIADAIATQARDLAFVYRTQFTSAPAEALAARLAALAPGDLDYVFFVNSGSEAMEAAVRLALQYWQERGEPGRRHIVSRRVSYHGMTVGALSLSGHAGRRRLLEPLLHTCPVAPPAYCYRCPFGLQRDSCDLACADAIERLIETHGPQNVAAVVVEPVVGASGGAIPAPDGYLSRLRAICDRFGVLLVFDEVMTGLGRTGAWFACEHEGVVPDVLVVGKGLNAGYTPMSAVIARRPLIDVLRRGSGVAPFGHTHSGNPLSAATCLAVLDYVERHGLIAAARERGAELRAGLAALAVAHPIIGDVRGRGLLLGVELVADRTTRTRFRPTLAVAQRVVAAARAEGLVLYPAGVPETGDAVLVAPPLVISSAEVGELLEGFDAALERVEAEVMTPEGGTR